jgi:HK97 gp10 family phage protein
MARITGDKKHSDRLRKIAAQSAQAVTRGLYLAGQEIELEAERSITAGSISGKNHVPSAPGQPPNADTRLLDSSIETNVVAQNPPTVHVTSNAPYSAALEFGTSRMAERPFMRPALQKKRGEVARLAGQAVRAIIK